MKKMFGVLSLIAIFTVAFTSQASANGSPDIEVVYDIGNVDHDFVAVSVELVVEGEVFYVADETVKVAGVEDLSESGNSVSIENTLSTFDSEFYIRGKEQKLFEFYPDEISFSSNEFVGLTIEEARHLKFEKDKKFLQS